jgi:hypothetical protein
MPLNLGITNEEKIPVTCTPTTSTGNSALLDGALRVSVISGDSTFSQDPGTPNTVSLISSSTPGDTTFLIEGDADLGAGVTLIQDTVTLSVAGALAANLGLSAGAAEPK